MRHVRNRAALLAGRLTGAVMRIGGKNSTALPGYIAEKFGNSPLYQMMRQRSFHARIVVTGTNGKTTTTLLIKNILERAGFEVVNNSSGSNLSRGVLTTLLRDKRQGQWTILLLEVDEASMPAVVSAVQPDRIVVTNIFRDQLDRYGEVDFTRHLLEQAIGTAPNTRLILNADDPHVARLAGDDKNAIFFGLDVTGIEALKHDHASDVPGSPETGSPLIYQRRYFGHVGLYRAKDRSFERPYPDVSVSKIHPTSAGQKISLRVGERHAQIESQMRGLYSAYNAAAALTVAYSLEIDIRTAEEAVMNSKAAFGRQESLDYAGSQFSFYLVKNPTGFNQVIQAELQKMVNRPLLIIINDNFADGRDVSWLWDVAIEDIHPKIEVVVSGTRAYDMALRMEYAGRSCQVIEDPLDALGKLAQNNSHIIVLPTYTALLQIRKALNLALEHRS